MSSSSEDNFAPPKEKKSKRYPPRSRNPPSRAASQRYDDQPSTSRQQRYDDQPSTSRQRVNNDRPRPNHTSSAGPSTVATPPPSPFSTRSYGHLAEDRTGHAVNFHTPPATAIRNRHGQREDESPAVERVIQGNVEGNVDVPVTNGEDMDVVNEVEEQLVDSRSTSRDESRTISLAEATRNESDYNTDDYGDDYVPGALNDSVNQLQINDGPAVVGGGGPPEEPDDGDDDHDTSSSSGSSLGAINHPHVPFMFEDSSYPKPNTRFAIPILHELPAGRCERFFRESETDEVEDDENFVRCLNCLRKRRDCIEDGNLEYVEPIHKWWYERVPGGEPGEYRFIDDPFENHGALCTADKITMGEYGVKYVMRNGLYWYQRNPNRPPIDAFMDAIISLPSIMAARYPSATKHDVKMHTPDWNVQKTAWNEARAESLPEFTYNDIAPEYLYTYEGLDPTSDAFGELFINVAEEGTGYIFAMSDTCARAARTCTDIIVDGTFRAVKGIRKCQQLFTVHGRTVSGEVIPLGYFLLPRKTQEMYLRALGDLRQKITDANGGDADLGDVLKSFLADWEFALDLAVETHFPELRRRYCAFHFSQSIIRAVARYGLTRSYRLRDPVVMNYVHCVLGTMLIPPDLMEEFCAMMELVPEHRHPAIQVCLEEFKEYVCSTYLRDADKRARLDAYSLGLGEPRTTNAAEGYHSALYESLRIHGSDIRRLLYLLKRKELTSNTRIYQLANNMPPRARNDIYVQLDIRIHTMKEQIGGIMAPLVGARHGERLETLRRYSRYCSHVLGGAHHPHLVGPMHQPLQQALNNINNAAPHFNLANINPALIDLAGIDIEPFHIVPE